MVQAWYMVNNTQQPQAENHRNPAKYISIEDLRKKTGVEYFQINIETYKSDNVLEDIKKERGYTYEDEMTCSDACENYQDRLKIFFTEHLHKDEEIRLVLDGEGYFDVRDADDEWIRIHVTTGDMLILPSGIYHRFTLTPKNYVRAKRFFIGEPVWQPYNRPADEMTCRQLYVDKLHKGFTQAC